MTRDWFVYYIMLFNQCSFKVSKFHTLAIGISKCCYFYWIFIIYPEGKSYKVDI